MDSPTLARFAELAVDFGANVQEGQIVSLAGSPGKEPLVRAIAERAYVRGAKFVDLAWFDPWVKRARIEHAAEDTLEFVPAWYGERILALGRERSAVISLSGPVAPGLLDDLDPVRAGRDRLPSVRESGEVTNRRELNWTILPGPTPAWAQLVHPDLEPDAALEKLEEQLIHVLRLDSDDPVGLWKERADKLIGRGRAPDRARLRRAALHRRGHRPDARPAPGHALDGRPLLDRRRHRAHAQPPHRGGLHLARPAAGRRARALHEAAGAERRHRGPRTGGALRGRPRERAHRRRPRRRRCGRS